LELVRSWACTSIPMIVSYRVVTAMAGLYGAQAAILPA
jgi:hypothetical protein